LTSDNFRDENRFHQQHGSGHGINRYQESEPFQCDIEVRTRSFSFAMLMFFDTCW